MLHEALDGAALAGGVAPLEQHDDALTGLLHPVLRLEELHLQELHVPQVDLLAQAGLVGKFS